MFFKSQKGKGAAAPRDKGATPGDKAPAATRTEAQHPVLGLVPGPASGGTSNGSMLPLSPDERRRRADHAHRVMQAFGSIVAVYMRSPAHRNMRLSEIERIVGPAVVTGQFSLAEATHKENGLVMPVGVLLWGSVSLEIDRRLQALKGDAPFTLAPREWKSGDIVWLVEVIGSKTVVDAMLRRQHETSWRGRTVRTRNADAGAVKAHPMAAQRAK